VIRDVLFPLLMSRFPRRGLRTGSSPDLVATFPAAHSAIGDLTIWDEGDEATLAIGMILHEHFNPEDASLTAEQIAERVAADVLDFLENLFADRVLFWRSPDSRSRGWLVSGEDHGLPLINEDVQTFRWSGPVKNPLDRGRRPGV
jgi:hypothetical protein